MRTQALSPTRQRQRQALLLWHAGWSQEKIANGTGRPAQAANAMIKLWQFQAHLTGEGAPAPDPGVGSYASVDLEMADLLEGMSAVERPDRAKLIRQLHGSD